MNDARKTGRNLLPVHRKVMTAPLAMSKVSARLSRGRRAPAECDVPVRLAPETCRSCRLNQHAHRLLRCHAGHYEPQPRWLCVSPSALQRRPTPENWPAPRWCYRPDVCGSSQMCAWNREHLAHEPARGGTQKGQVSWCIKPADPRLTSVRSVRRCRYGSSRRR